MKTAVDCLPCYLRQALQVARMSSDDAETQHEAVAKVATLLPDLDMDQTPPVNAICVYDAIAQVTGCQDPYREAKMLSNEQAMQILPLLREEIRRSENSLAAAVRFAIAGNIIDYGASADFDITAALQRCRTAVPVVDHLDLFLAKVSGLKRAANVLYLADNCGEIGYDRLVLECLAERGLNLTVVVKSQPIINDALLEDAMFCGIDQFAAIIANGTACPGTPLPYCSTALQRLFSEADLVIAKGQGNFETLSEEAREIFFLLTVKCPVVGRHIAELTGRQTTDLPGKGELVVYASGNHFI